jgi:serpin B
MHRLLVTLIMATLATTLLLGCQPQDADEAPPEMTDTVEPEVVPEHDPAIMETDDMATADLAELNTGNREFALAAFQRLAAAQDADDNLLISPHSILSALAMVYAGAEGETRSQMREVLRFALDEPALHVAFQALDESLDERSRIERDDDAQGFELSIVNRLWGHHDYEFLPDYLEQVERYYGAGIERVDFESDPNAARLEINAWVEDQTRERIRDLLPEGALDEDTRMVLVNAIYFLASWQEAFAEDQTRSEPFRRLDGSSVDVELMHKTAHFQAHVDDQTMAVSIPYLGGDVSLLAMMPTNSEDDFQSWQASLTRPRFDDIVASLDRKKVALDFPRFTTDSGFRLARLLRDMGMTDAFSRMAANFERMTGVGPGVMGRSLYIDEVFHQTFIDLDEAGTEAAAATAVVMMRLTAAPVEEEPLELRFDRPFIYAIYDHPTDSILFLGRMLDPGEG